MVGRLSAEPLRLTEGAADLGLSPKQREVAWVLAQGKSNQDIASGLGITLITASDHVKQVFARLGVHDRAAVGKALSRGHRDEAERRDEWFQSATPTRTGG